MPDGELIQDFESIYFNSPFLYQRASHWRGLGPNGWYVNNAYMCLIGLPKLLAGATNLKFVAIVEKRSRPITTWGTGLTVPPSSAWAAIGKYGVAVEMIVAVLLGGAVVANTVGELRGVMANAVGELITGAAARVGR